MLIDLDDFQVFNETQGYLIGDKALMAVSKAIKKVVKGEGVVGKFGGDSWIVLLPGIPLSEARQLGQVLHREIKNTVVAFRGRSLRIGASIGISALGQRGVDNTLRRAARALRDAKAKGGNRV